VDESADGMRVHVAFGSIGVVASRIAGLLGAVTAERPGAA
jgi:hypothetical protein